MLNLKCLFCHIALIGNQKKFCSRACGVKTHNKIVRTKRIIERKQLRLGLKCLFCDKTLPDSCRILLYCSVSCRQKFSISRAKDKRHTIAALRPAKKCLMCENFILIGERKYCSKVCSKKAVRNNKFGYQKMRQLSDNGLKKKLVSLAGDRCQSCGYNKNYASLQFHHIDPKQKSFCLSGQNIRRFSWEKTIKEMTKCLLLCANCHFELHNPKLERVDITTQHNKNSIIYPPFSFVS